MDTVVADVVWPALFLEEKLLTVAAIVIGLLIEILVLHLALRVEWRRAICTGLLMNAVSALVGVVLIPVGGFVWEAMWESLGGRYGAAASWAGLWPLAACTNTIVELPFAWKVGRVPFRAGLVAWLLATNAVTVGLAFGLMLLSPRTHF